MRNYIPFTLISASLIAIVFFFSGCKNNDPSVLKIFVRSNSNELLPAASVVIVGDPASNPATLNYVDTLVTNASGFAQFNMDTYFDMAGEGNETGYFDVIVKKETVDTAAYVRCRRHLTTVETVYLNY
jgi:hypothetical protein